MDLGYDIFEDKIIIKIRDRICETADEALTSDLFEEVLGRCLKRLERRKSPLLGIFESGQVTPEAVERLIQTLLYLTKMPGPLVPNVVEGSEPFFRDKILFNEFVEYLYNYWRSYDRFILCDSTGDDMDKRPYRTFNNTIERLTHLIRAVYRDIQEGITEVYPRVYRQVRAGAEIAAISLPKPIPLPDGLYARLKDVPVIRQILLYPPLILNPPMNRRTGRFEQADANPLQFVEVDPEHWLCYPAKVGPLLILIYFHKKFYELGFSLCNLFELADDEDLKRKPDAVYAFGAPDMPGAEPEAIVPGYFIDDENDLIAAAVSNRDEFGYFGYLKKMVLTLHNVTMMKRGKFPFHGALLRITLKSGAAAVVLLIGDTGAGKSETIEALREIGESEIQDMIIIADDMGSVDVPKPGRIVGYGTEIGAFLRLDDLRPGYAFGQIDRAIIMSAAKVNARIVLPVACFDHVMKGYEIDFILYANNYDAIDDEHPIIERLSSPDDALRVFRKGTVMSKGTTTSTGLVNSYFANIFGPPQNKELHEALARRYFKEFFKAGVFVGELRTRLGIEGRERSGPEEAAVALLGAIRARA